MLLWKGLDGNNVSAFNRIHARHNHHCWW
jgi:hypothetical protein